jgi:hypothetical protein
MSTIEVESDDSSFVFNTRKEWIIKLSKKGIVFNHEVYPKAKPMDFAMAFMEILETLYDVKFEKKNKAE